MATTAARTACTAAWRTTTRAMATTAAAIRTEVERVLFPRTGTQLEAAVDAGLLTLVDTGAAVVGTINQTR